jgi:hypothetical protein
VTPAIAKTPGDTATTRFDPKNPTPELPFRAMIFKLLEVRPFEGGRDMTDRWLSFKENDE